MNILEIIFWLLLIFADVLIMFTTLQILITNIRFKNKVTARVKKLEETIYKEEK